MLRQEPIFISFGPVRVRVARRRGRGSGSSLPRRYTWTGLSPDTVYRFSVRARNSDGQSAFSSVLTTSTEQAGAVTHQASVTFTAGTPTVAATGRQSRPARQFVTRRRDIRSRVWQLAWWGSRMGPPSGSSTTPTTWP